MKEITNDNENLYVEDVTDNKEMDNVIIPGGSNLEDEEDLSSASSSVDSYEKNDDLMNILSKGKKMIKETYEDPIRMYLKEIGDVKLFSRKDEEVLARTIDLKFKYKKIAIWDPDIHQGNGHQSIFWDNKKTFRGVLISFRVITVFSICISELIKVSFLKERSK